MSQYSALFCLVLAFSAGASCNCQSDVSADAGPQEIQLGTGSLAYEPLAGDQELVLVSGVQGGYHFVVNARIRGLLSGNPSVPNELGNPRTKFSIFREDGSQIDGMGPIYRLGYRPAEEGWSELPSGTILQVNQQLVVDEGLVPAIYAERVRLHVEVRDASDRTAQAEVWVIPTRDPTPDAGLFIDAGIDGG